MTVRLVWELGAIGVASVWGRKCMKAEMSVKEKVAKWYLSFARLDADVMRVWEWCRISRVNQERLRKARL